MRAGLAARMPRRRPMNSVPGLADRATRLVGSPIDSSTSLLARQRHDIVRFAMGSPADDMVPTALISDLARGVFCTGAAGPLQYAASEGDPALRGPLLALLEDRKSVVEGKSVA